MPDQLPRTFEEAEAWAKKCAVETGEMPNTISNPTAGLVFDLEKATITRSVWDEDHNLLEMTYCAITNRVLKKRIMKQKEINQL